jgi:steroid 5-alpha reductase family enzyme
MSSQNRASLLTVVVVLIIGALVAFAGSQGGATFAGIPLFAIAVTAAFAIQILVWIPSTIARTERFFDLTGSATFVLVSIGLVLLAPAPDLRSGILAAMVVVWAVRLGTFLAVRIHRAGSDDRFDEIKTSPLRFLRVWIVQGLWVSVTAAAAWIAIGTTAEARKPIEWIAIVGIAIWVVGLVIEVVADVQKTRFRADPANAGRFIDTGLWSRSRHPNYFGEILLWIGVMVVAAPVLQGWQWVALLSPVLVTLLLTRVSGIPLLEAKAEKRWGNDDDYRAYVKRTPTLVPRLSSPAGR